MPIYFDGHRDLRARIPSDELAETERVSLYEWRVVIPVPRRVKQPRQTRRDSVRARSVERSVPGPVLATFEHVAPRLRFMLAFLALCACKPANSRGPSRGGHHSSANWHIVEAHAAAGSRSPAARGACSNEE